MRDRLLAFVAERCPFAMTIVREAIGEAASIEEIGRRVRGIRLQPDPALVRLKPDATYGPDTTTECTPGVSVEQRLRQATEDLVAECEGFLRREEIRVSLTPDERREILRGMLLTRATDNRLKMFFTSGEVKYGAAGFQGKGFRSLGQEAIYAAAIRLKRGSRWRGPGDEWQGDVVAPIIRDVGAALAMRPEPATVRMILNAQMGKAGPPMNGRDLHIGDMPWGIVPASAPLGISSLTAAGFGLAFALQGADRIAVSFIGEGGSSLGEWHEAINLCAARRLPVVFCLENNQTALSTPVRDQSRVRVFADKAAGYGIPGITIDGTDPDEVAAAFTWAAERARSGEGPALIELVCFRVCGHAHHDDMLYLGKEPPLGWTYPPPTPGGYVDPDLFAFWSARDPIARYAARLQADGLVTAAQVDEMKADVAALVDTEARAVVAAPWPDANDVSRGVFAETRRHVGEPAGGQERAPGELAVEAAPPFDGQGATFLEGVMLGVRDALESDPRVFVFGEDVGGRYGNAFLLLRPLLAAHGSRILNAPLAEGAVLGGCIGAALGGMRPIGEMQFNDFVATGFNQLVNSAAKTRYRWGGSVPMVIRMPWGGLRHAGPYHSQNTEPWFFRTPGLKIVVPSTPYDARALMAAAVADPDPVLFYEHIALYRDPRIKQRLAADPSPPLAIGQAALRRAGGDLLIVSYGAYVHVALRVAERLARTGIEASVLDLRSLAPWDRSRVLALARKTGKVLLVHEDSKTGGIGQSIAAVIQEEVFESLDAPVRVIGALDTPVPYSPSLEDAFLPSEDEIERAARALAAY